MSVRTARPIGQSLHPAVFIAREDFVACFAGDIELPAQHRHLLPVQQSSHKTQPLVHLATLPPRHLGSPQMPESVTHVPGMKCHLCARKHNTYFRYQSLPRMLPEEGSIAPKSTISGPRLSPILISRASTVLRQRRFAT